MSRYCFRCDADSAILHRGDDGNLTVTCKDCGHERGPFFSLREQREMEQQTREVQSGLGDFA